MTENSPPFGRRCAGIELDIMHNEQHAVESGLSPLKGVILTNKMAAITPYLACRGEMRVLVVIRPGKTTLA